MTAVENGLSALAAIQQRDFAVIACDVKMGFLDGVRLYHALEVEYPELRSRFFFISGIADDPEVAAAIRQTGAPSCASPSTSRIFLELVRDVATEGGSR